MNTKKIEKLIEQLLVELGEDPKREGLVKTPQRVAQVMAFITNGSRQTGETIINGAVFSQEINNMIVVKDIEVYSTCEHHLLPFFGQCHIGYIPDGKILGISKLARIVDMFAQRLQVQERLTAEIAEALMEAVSPLGVGVVIEARHMCMMMRGVEKQNSSVTTSSVLGSFLSHQATREEFLLNIGRKR